MTSTTSNTKRPTRPADAPSYYVKYDGVRGRGTKHLSLPGAKQAAWEMFSADGEVKRGWTIKWTKVRGEQKWDGAVVSKAGVEQGWYFLITEVAAPAPKPARKSTAKSKPNLRKAGPRGCNECGAPAGMGHADNCITQMKPKSKAKAKVETKAPAKSKPVVKRKPASAPVKRRTFATTAKPTRKPAAGKLPALRPMGVLYRNKSDDSISVYVEWAGGAKHGVTRKHTTGWRLGENQRPLAKRLMSAISAGVVATNPVVTTDKQGEVYVKYDNAIVGAKTLNADLKRLGY